MATANYCNQQSDYVSKILTEKRKAKKPLMEKMRRARINDSLNELKSLILEALNKDASRYSKMEKADVLEMTVHYLRELKRREHQDFSSSSECRASYVQCASQLTRKMTSPETCEQLQANFLAQLASRCQGNKASTTVTSVPLFNPESLQYMTPLQPVMIPFPSPPPSPLHASPMLPASTSLTRDMVSLSPNTSRNNVFMSSHETKLSTPGSSSALWRPW
ncbi:hypothetical protein ABFA07_011386 [Porites harrisoni]|mmetsp:Transcript_1445/g.2516  ORF Transcript_1445/g.2516 Transcript_1445/m.2516 type:complete len:220 (-) Transcript_1445:325-984(-)